MLERAEQGIMVRHMMCTARRWKFLRAVTAALCLAVFLAPAASRPAPAQQAAAKGQAGARAPAKDAGGTAGGSEAELRQRIERLEEQIVDMQVLIGTLESLAKSGAAAAGGGSRAGGGGLPPGDAARLDGLETQIRALTAQIEQVAAEVRAGGGAVRAGGPGAGVQPQAFSGPGAGIPGAVPAAGGFGETTVKAEETDSIGSLIAADGGSAAPSPSSGAPRSLPVDNPKQLYEAAYGYLLQQDYAAAEAAFQEFLNRYPNDSFSGNAQYWLGESLFVRGQYKAAASAFLKGYETYAGSAKAPDSLLKLAMSLDRLGQKEAACSSYSELTAKFPNMPSSVKSRAQAERQRAGCP